MEAILLFSHGSVLCGAERNLLALAARMRDRGDAPIVEVGFLNYTDPLFHEAVARCVAQGATRITVAPYFLIDGKFVAQDLPGQIQAARAAHPELEFVVAGVIGFHPALPDAVLEAARTARPPAAWLEATDAAGSACQKNPKCPLYGNPPCSVRLESHA